MTKPLYFWNGSSFELVGPTTPQSPFAYQTSAPTAPATGDIWIDSDGDVDTYNRQLTRYYFVASAGQTSVSGTDANGLTLAYVAGSEAVYVNGALQVRGVDYTATNGTSITNLSALAASDVVEVFAYTAFTVANAYTKSETDGLIQAPYRNLVINGDMQIAQRNTSVASITTSGYYTADRWYAEFTSLGTWTQSVENDAPSDSGFRKSLKMLCTTADASPAAGDWALIQQRLEGQNLQQILKGTSSAKPLTVSFWVKANVTGTYNVALYDSDNSGRAQSRTYTISSSATWEKKTVTFSGDTTGVLDNDNARSLDLTFWLGAGSNLTSGTANPTWSTTAANLAPGNVNVGSTTNNYWQITGVQLEVGSVATPFEFVPAQQELAQCQRYYYRYTSDTAFGVYASGFASSTTQAYFSITPPVPLRTKASSIDVPGTITNLKLTNYLNTNYTISSITLLSDSTTLTTAIGVVASGMTTGQGVFIGNNNTTAGFLGINAEL